MMIRISSVVKIYEDGSGDRIGVYVIYKSLLIEEEGRGVNKII